MPAARRAAFAGLSYFPYDASAAVEPAPRQRFEVAASAGVEVTSKGWAENVLNATTKVSTTVKLDAPGAHVLRIYMLDPGVVLDRVVLNTGGLRPSYLGPPETRVIRQNHPR